jgi:hypothetical protein
MPVPGPFQPYATIADGKKERRRQGYPVKSLRTIVGPMGEGRVGCDEFASESLDPLLSYYIG